MFTGIVEAVGEVVDVQPRGLDMRANIAVGKLARDDLALGESIAVSGVCLTVAELTADGFWADVSGETLARTSLKDAVPGTKVNLERAVTLGTRLGGHLVSGHVDGIGTVEDLADVGRSTRIRIRVPDALARYIAEKGSICVDGISLTVNDVRGARFDVNIVPHTMAATTLGGYRVDTRVNLEVDIVARYLERLLLGDQAARVAVMDDGMFRKRCP